MVAVPRIVVHAAVGAVLAMTACGDGTDPSTPTRLVFVVEPNAIGVSSALAPAVVIAVTDAAGRTVRSWPDSVRLVLEPSDGAVTMLGTMSVAPVSGTAVFDDLRVQGFGSGYRLVARSGSLVEGMSRPFTVHDVFVSQSVAAGYEHTCALTADGTPYCWGSNRYGRLGDGTLNSRIVPTPVAGGLQFTELAVGDSHSCGLTAAGTVYCWGGNFNGQLGNGTAESASVPQQVTFASPFVDLDVGYDHTCGLTADGRAYCWGDNWMGQLGDGTDSSRTVPTPVAGSLTFTSISTGYLHSCGLTVSGAAYCWGGNLYGEVGDGTYNMDEGPRLEPTAVIGGHIFASLIAGGGPCHGKTCGITPEGTTLCWGRSYQILSGALLDRYPTSPTAIEGDPGFVTVDPGPLGVCGISADSSLYCWGTGMYGGVGTGTPDDLRLPTPILPDSSFVSVSLGEYHTCAVTTGGATLCWGTNSDGQLGNGSSPEGWLFPVPVWKP